MILTHKDFVGRKSLSPISRIIWPEQVETVEVREGFDGINIKIIFDNGLYFQETISYDVILKASLVLVVTEQDLIDQGIMAMFCTDCSSKTLDPLTYRPFCNKCKSI